MCFNGTVSSSPILHAAVVFLNKGKKPSQPPVKFRQKESFFVKWGRIGLFFQQLRQFEPSEASFGRLLWTTVTQAEKTLFWSWIEASLHRAWIQCLWLLLVLTCSGESHLTVQCCISVTKELCHLLPCNFSTSLSLLLLSSKRTHPRLQKILMCDVGAQPEWLWCFHNLKVCVIWMLQRLGQIRKETSVVSLHSKSPWCFCKNFSPQSHGWQVSSAL